MNVHPSMNAPKNNLLLPPIALISLLTLLSLAIYLVMSVSTFRLGFPLDDAWIHQTYARNLAEQGEWAFTPGKPSAGSTSPLWTFLLAPGHWHGFSYLWWSYLLGGLCLIGLGMLGKQIIVHLAEVSQKTAFIMGSFLVFEWHLVWAAVSGMETLLFCVISLLVASELLRKSPHWLRLGIFIGISLWVRPDGITLIGPAFFAALLCTGDAKLRLLAAFKIGLGVTIFLLPYGLFNHSVSGSWLPNTFFAKQAEYAILRESDFAARLLSQLKTFLVGPGVLLAPAFVIELGYLAHQRRWAALGMAVWVLGYLLIYAVRLPVTYQHGRYLMPVMPVFFVLSLAGLYTFLSQPHPQVWRKVLGSGWKISIIILTLAFYVLGGRAYAQDVAVIESEMVAASQWVALNTQPGSLIAAHDIGALGFFGGHPLLDLAGLISPEVIPIIRDEARIADYLDQQGVAYLMTFPDWYPALTAHRQILFDTKGEFSPALGGSNMQVFLWP